MKGKLLTIENIITDKSTEAFKVADCFGSTVGSANATAKELVRRWNAFEKDGSHDALLSACERYVRMQEEINQEMGRKPTNTMYDIMKAAIAQGKE